VTALGSSSLKGAWAGNCSGPLICPWGISYRTPREHLSTSRAFVSWVERTVQLRAVQRR
jgi:hypothetical protein